MHPVYALANTSTEVELEARFLAEYMTVFREHGRGEFVTRYRMKPVLIGQTCHNISMKSQGNAFDTFSMIPSTEVEYLLPGSFVDRVWMLERQKGSTSVVIGRWSNHDVAIPDYSISRTHCAIEVTTRGFTISDAGSRNGTLVNGIPLNKEEPYPLKGEEIITLGRFNFVFMTGRQFMALLVQRIMESRAKNRD